MYVHVYSLRKRHNFYVHISAITKKIVSDLNWKDQLHSVWQAELCIEVSFDSVVLKRSIPVIVVFFSPS